MKERFLPIGTIVVLEDGTKPLMITGYCIIPNSKAEDQTKIEMYDYSSCPYPEGIMDSDVAIVFNHDQIENILYLGYESEEYKKTNETLNANHQQMLEEVAKLNGQKREETPAENEKNKSLSNVTPVLEKEEPNY